VKETFSFRHPFSEEEGVNSLIDEGGDDGRQEPQKCATLHRKVESYRGMWTGMGRRPLVVPETCLPELDDRKKTKKNSQ